jgi:putative restriction endonuclease
MTTMNLKGPATIDDLLQCPKDGRKYELVDGEILVSPAGWHHAQVVVKMVHIIATFLEAHPIGAVCGDNLSSLPNQSCLGSPVRFLVSSRDPYSSFLFLGFRTTYLPAEFT